MKNSTLSEILFGGDITFLDRIIDSAALSPESQNAWDSIEDYFKNQRLSNNDVGEIEVAINIQIDGKVFINYGCKNNNEQPTKLSIAEALDIIKLAAINGLNTSVFFPSISLREMEEPKTLICSITLLFSI